jgi:hypothetical protein
MPVLLVTFGKSSEGYDYQGLADALAGLDSVRLCETAFAVKTEKNPQELYRELVDCLGPHDPLYVMALCGPFRGRGPKAINQFLNQKLEMDIYRLRLFK